MPSDSQFAVAMKSQKEAERAEQQRIKNLVLNYDLTDSNADRSGTDCDYFSHPNPNIHVSPLSKLLTHNDQTEGLDGEKYVSPHHQHNSSLQQSSTPNQSTNTRSSDRTSSNRRSQQARKLQLSDVGW